MKTEILKIKGDWQDVVNDCRNTVSKGELGKEPSNTFKKSILIAEHSPIRSISARFRWSDIKYWVAMHWKTHIWGSNVNTQRNDRQDNYDRNKAPQDAPVSFIGEMNAQHTIDTMRKRLCYMASPETRELAEDFKITLKETQPEWADVLVPNCVYRCGCPESASCGFFKALCDKDIRCRSVNIQQRYDAYNNLFYNHTYVGERKEND